MFDFGGLLWADVVAQANAWLSAPLPGTIIAVSIAMSVLGFVVPRVLATFARVGRQRANGPAWETRKQVSESYGGYRSIRRSRRESGDVD